MQRLCRQLDSAQGSVVDWADLANPEDVLALTNTVFDFVENIQTITHRSNGRAVAEALRTEAGGPKETAAAENEQEGEDKPQANANADANTDAIVIAQSVAG